MEFLSRIKSSITSKESNFDHRSDVAETVSTAADTQSIQRSENYLTIDDYGDDDVDLSDAKSVISQTTIKSQATVKSHTRSLKSIKSNNTNNHRKTPDNGKMNGSSQRPILKSNSITVNPSYKAKNDLTSVIEQSTKQEIKELNERYIRTRRYDTAGKYRIGPTFITKSRLAYLDAHKPAKLSVVPDPLFKSLEFGLLTYLWTFTDQHDKQEIDLAFLQSLIDSGVNINCADEHGQTALHAVVRDWHPDVALFIVRNNADVNAQDKMGRSPLHLAAAINCVEIAKILLLNGAQVDLETKNELQTPMHYAAKYNSLDTMKLLIKFQGSITQRDTNDRTVLFLAAEQGSTETAQFLLDIGAPAGIYDSEGNSAIGYLLEKMPHVAYRALHQFVVPNRSLKYSDMYLMYLENYNRTRSSMTQKSPLEIITIYDDTDLVMHPVIQKAIEVKWKLIGRKDTLRKLLITLIYQVCWMVLAYTFTDDNNYYSPMKENGWKILFEALIVMFAIYFFCKDVQIKKHTIQYHTAWVESRQHLIRSNYVYCHPSWPGDRENLEAEAERVRSVPSLVGKQKTWFAYEWVMLLVLFTIIVTRILTMTIDSTELFIAHKTVFCAGLIFSALRVLKIIIRFQFFSVFLKVSGLVVTSFLQIILLYMQIFIPFVAVFWLSFGGVSGDELLNSNKNNTLLNMIDIDYRKGALTNLNYIFYHVFSSSFGQGLLNQYVYVDTVTAQILSTLYHVLVTFILLSILVALVTSKFTTQYTRCVAEASLLQASIVLQLEKNLSKKDKMMIAKYYKRNCNPLPVQTEEHTETVLKRNALSQLRLAERRLTGVENIVNEAEERYLKNDRRSQIYLMENIDRYVRDFQTNEEEFAKTLNTNMNEILQKQEYMNRYLPKLLKLNS